MTARAWLAEAVSRLQSSGSPDARVDAEWLLCDALETERFRLRFRLGEELSPETARWLESALERRIAGEPLQYIEGFAVFMGRRFIVDERALIPRQDTETLCEFALDWIANRRVRVLDLCTGGGALAVCIIAECPDADVSASDISEAAIDLARQNARLHGVEIGFFVGDLFAPLGDSRFELIVCNPPYLSEADMRTLQSEVRHEPQLALFGGRDGLDFYRRIASELPARLLPGGMAAFEVGDGQAEAVKKLLLDALPGASCGFVADLNGKNRVVYASRQNQ